MVKKKTIWKKTLISLSKTTQASAKETALLKQHQIVISEQEKTVTKQIMGPGSSPAGCRQEETASKLGTTGGAGQSQEKEGHGCVCFNN